MGKNCWLKDQYKKDVGFGVGGASGWLGGEGGG